MLVLFMVGQTFSLLMAQAFTPTDTIFPTQMIAPLDVDLSDHINMPLQDAESIGDVNGDGFGDFVFNKYVADEKSDELDDVILKAVIITDIHNPKAGWVIRNAIVKGIGDYNGDGFDDMVELQEGFILLGNQNGSDFQRISIILPDNTNELYFSGDLNDDGKSDFILGTDYNSDSVLVYSVLHTTPKVLHPAGNYQRFEETNTLINAYDYDGDDTTELCIAFLDIAGDKYIIGWYIYDSTENQYVTELVKTRQNNFPGSYAFAAYFSDINGDGLKDICHTYFDNGMQIEAHLATNTGPYYFENAIDLQINHPNRLIYHAGDINNDGADDWYSKSATDSIVVYYGSDSIEYLGFNREYYPIDPSILIMPPFLYTTLIFPPKVLYYNDDNIADLMFNYWSYNSYLQYDTIGTSIYLGGITREFTHPIVLGNPAQESFQQLQFGQQVKNIGDYNRDGIDDWAILYQAASRANIYFGGNPLDYEPNVTILLPQAPFNNCYDLATGDFNGDDFMDIIISNSSSSDIRMFKSLLNEVENIYVFYGAEYIAPELTLHQANKIFESYNIFTGFGKSICNIGDYNADGYVDLAVASGTNMAASKKAYIYFGGESFEDEPDMIIKLWIGSNAFDFGVPLAAIGDINQDGYPDFSLSNHDYLEGRSLIYFGGPNADTEFDMEIKNPDSTGRMFGNKTSRTAGDFDGDGYPDLVYAHYSQTLVYKGGPDFDNQIDYTLSESSLYYPNQVSFAKNFSTQNKSDILISDMAQEGEVFVFYGGDSNMENTSLVLKGDNLRSFGLCSGDFNQDSYTDVFVGYSEEPNFGYRYGGFVNHFVSPLYTKVTEVIEESVDCQIFPNPVNANTQLIFSTKEKESIQVYVYNTEGRVILQSSSRTNEIVNLNFESLPAGLYIAQGISSSKTIQRKFIKN